LIIHITKKIKKTFDKAPSQKLDNSYSEFEQKIINSKNKNKLLSLEHFLKRITGIVILIFIIFSFYYQIKILNFVLEYPEKLKSLWKVLAIITTSFTVIFSTTIIGVFKAEPQKHIVPFITPPNS